ncbi:MAG: hypothetical protein Q8Q09_03480 [Deltaproteobacteria bacterium]|nr:hypothetical protein [Deltaproteobacteria bacterium]
MERDPRPEQLILDVGASTLTTPWTSLDPGLSAFDADNSARRCLERKLSADVGALVFVRWTDNTRTMLSTRRRGDALLLRLHRMFASAPGDVVAAVGSYLARCDHASAQVIDAFISRQRDCVRQPPRRPEDLITQGTVHDLAALTRSLWSAYFQGPLEVHASWSRIGYGRKRARKKTIRLGLYLFDEQRIRVHPVLDQDWVPEFFVGWVVFHELAHHVIGQGQSQGRREVHSQAFRRLESTYREHERARTWERENLAKLIATRRRATS